jgi:DNA-binding Lrp family transcriptional regulator
MDAIDRKILTLLQQDASHSVRKAPARFDAPTYC